MTTNPPTARDRIAEALYAHSHPGWATRYTDLDRDERDTYLARASAVLAALPTAADRAACICGHTEQQHFEDVCITELTGCACGDFLPPDAAREVIARYQEAVKRAEAERDAYGEQLDEAAETIAARGVEINRLTDELRRVADEAQQPEPRCTCGETACESELCDCDSAPCPADHAVEARQQPDTETPDLPDRLEAVLTERFTELGNPFSRMRIAFQGQDGWPASKEVGPRDVALVLRELLADAPAVVAQPEETTS